MRLDPLYKLEESRSRALIPEKVYARVMERYRYVTEGIERVERASGIEYPEYYIEPSMVVADAQYSLGLMFARTIPVVKGMYDDSYDHYYGSDGGSRLSIVVQVTAPLVAYGLKGTIHAILAHEFLHYIELLARFINMNVISDEVSNSIFESVYADMSRVVEPRIAFRRDRALIRLVARKFQDGLSDHRLEEKCMKDWIEKGLPTVRMSVEENIARIPIEAIASFRIDEGLRSKIYEFISASSSNNRRRRKGW
ncbi:hypothetical protein HRbin04_00278 [archaeon HR04]|nr:hypothetical protein HRbin04_00278 [archaeon HR04]